MLISQEDFDRYVERTFPDVTDRLVSDRRIVDYCPYCKARMGLNVVRREYASFETGRPGRNGLTAREIVRNQPYLCCFRCPECNSERRWFLYEIGDRTYRVMAIPGDCGNEIDELPQDPPALRKAYSEAIRALDANCPMAAAAMIRRALQVITREILGAPRGNLGNELKWLQSKPNKLDVTLSQDFHDNAYIIKETSNQAAHPDEDPDLLSFTEEDALHLNTLFLDLVTELFVIPEATRRAKEEMIRKRKI